MNTNLSPRRLALDLLKRSSLNVQMAAVLSDQRRTIFSWGWNHGYVHAEEHAISRANPKRLFASKITIAGRRTKSGNIVCAKPCTKDGKDCRSLIHSRNIGVIEYLDKNGNWIEERP